MGFHPANFGFRRLFRSLVRSRHVKDGQTDRQTDRHHVSFYKAPSYGGRGIKSAEISHYGIIRQTMNSTVYPTRMSVKLVVSETSQT